MQSVSDVSDSKALVKRPAFLRMVLCKLYFWRMKMRMGQPVKSKWLRSLFSRNLLYGAPMYWGRLQKKANDGQGVGSWVIYVLYLLKHHLVLPLAEIVIHCLPRSEIRWEHSPLHAGPHDVQDAVKNRAQ